MSEQRDSEQAGAPVEETEASVTEVQAAVERANEVVVTETVTESTVVSANETTAIEASGAETVGTRPTIALSDGLPSAGPSSTSVLPSPATTPETMQTRAEPLGPAPIVSPTPFPAPTPPVSDGEIRVSADHPMAAFYTQAPLPPERRGNRLAGVLISFLATVGFAVVYAGVIALLLAPQLAPSQFLNGFLDALLAWSTIFAVIAFFVGLVIVVLIVGRAGWWAYVLGGFLVAVFVWAATVCGVVVDTVGFGGLVSLDLAELVSIALLPSTVAALLVAREVTVWFGAWIGMRGRRITRANAEALAEYERSLTDTQANQS